MMKEQLTFMFRLSMWQVIFIYNIPNKSLEAISLQFSEAQLYDKCICNVTSLNSLIHIRIKLNRFVPLFSHITFPLLCDALSSSTSEAKPCNAIQYNIAFLFMAKSFGGSCSPKYDNQHAPFVA